MTDIVQPALDLSVYRMLPCPLGVANLGFEQLKLKPVTVVECFVAIAIGPNLGDLQAVAAFGYPQDGAPGGIEVLQSFAMEEKAYRAVCEAARHLLDPLGFNRYLGTINMVSQVSPRRVVEKRPFYVAGVMVSAGRA